MTNENVLEINNVEQVVDSLTEFIVDQVNKNFKVKAGNLKALNSQVENMIKEFEYIEFKHIYREENKRADQLANMALDS